MDNNDGDETTILKKLMDTIYTVENEIQRHVNSSIDKGLRKIIDTKLQKCKNPEFLPESVL